VRYTRAAALRGRPAIDLMLMQTPYERVLAALLLDTKGNLRFVRTGSAAEGARVALVNVDTLLDGDGRHWDIELSWDPGEIALVVRDHGHDARTRPLRGVWRAPR
jgi:hypothetical protein